MLQRIPTALSFVSQLDVRIDANGFLEMAPIAVRLAVRGTEGLLDVVAFSGTG